jgi:hypothetical protein
MVATGIYPHVAAECEGIPAEVFADLLDRGEGRHPTKSPTASTMALAEGVRVASADARGDCEMRVYRDHPYRWLTEGPAREERGRPGWLRSGVAEAIDLEAAPPPAQPMEHPPPEPVPTWGDLMQFLVELDLIEVVELEEDVEDEEPPEVT